MPTTDATAEALAHDFTLVCSNDPGPYGELAALARLARDDEHPRVTLADSLKDYFEAAYMATVGDEDAGAALLTREVLGTVRDSIPWHALATSMLRGDFGEEWAGLEG